MELQVIKQRIYTIREQKVMLDFDLAELYEVETKRLKEAVRRNLKRFPADFMVELTQEEYRSLRTQIASLVIEEKHKDLPGNLRTQIASSSWGGSRYPPFAFTEHGVTALANILNSDRAIEMGIAVVRAFIALKEIALKQGKLSEQISAFKRLLEQRIDEHDAQLKHIYDTLEELLDKKVDEELEKEAWKNRDRIGFKS